MGEPIDEAADSEGGGAGDSDNRADDVVRTVPTAGALADKDVEEDDEDEADVDDDAIVGSRCC